MTSDIKPKDLYKWFKSETVRGIHNGLEEYWNVKTPFPSYEITSNGLFGYYHDSENIFVDPKQVGSMLKVFHSVGWNISHCQLFMTCFGEEDTHYINDICNKSNWERRKQLRVKFLNGRNYDYFLDFMSIRMQLEGIGSLGFRFAGSKIQVYESAKYKMAVEEMASTNDKNTSGEKALMESVIRGKEGLVSKEEIEGLRKGMELRVFAIKSGVVATFLGFYVGNEFEKLSEEEKKKLIRMNLTPREEDKKLYETIFKSKMPLTYDFIKSFLDRKRNCGI